MNQPQTSSPGTAHTNSSNTLLGQAQQWLNQGSMSDMLGRLPQSVKEVSTNVTSGYNKLSTTQKVVGGALLALGVGYLVRSNGKLAKVGQHHDAPTDTLHELLHFVNDRIEGYQRAVNESKDPQLTGYYKQLVSQSQRFANELNDYLRQQGDERETSTTLKGKFYRAWMDTKAALTGSDEKAILGSNIYGEEWAIKAYQEALDGNTLTGAMRLEVKRQYAQSKNLKKLQAKQ
jgi:uncharacterized protein (TIGR02284 family)